MFRIARGLICEAWDVIAEHTVLAANQAFAAQAGFETPRDTTYSYTYDG